MTTSAFAPQLENTSADTSANLRAMSAMVRPAPTLAALPGGHWKELALASMEQSNRCEVGGPKATPRLVSAMAQMGMKEMQMPVNVLKSSEGRRSVQAVQAFKTKIVAKKAKAPAKKAAAPANDRVVFLPPFSFAESRSGADQVGAFAPFSYWDPLSLSAEASAGTLAYYREAELKHGRVCMLASLGIYVGESYHPLFGGNIDGPAALAPAQLDLALFWPALIVACGAIEAITGFGRAADTDSQGITPELKPDVVPGDFGFDPLGLANTREKLGWGPSFRQYQDRELAHGRLAMIGTLGMIAQEIFLGDAPEAKIR
jgi:hypothetical protein